jgi:hypothetical protein
LNYDIENNVFYQYHNPNITNDLLTKEGLHYVSGEIQLNVDDWILDMGYVENYCYRYYDILDIYEEYHTNEFQYQFPIHNKVFSHPRCIKKYVLQNPLYQFYENHKHSEDLVQCNMLGYFCQGVYLEDISVVNIIYNDRGNTSWMPVEEKDVNEYHIMIKHMDDFFAQYHKIFEHLPYHQTFLNIK